MGHASAADLRAARARAVPGRRLREAARTRAVRARRASRAGSSAATCSSSRSRASRSRGLAEIARARGDLPLGSVGQLACEKLLPQIERLSQAVLRARAGSRLPPLPLVARARRRAHHRHPARAVAEGARHRELLADRQALRVRALRQTRGARLRARARTRRRLPDAGARWSRAPTAAPRSPRSSSRRSPSPRRCCASLLAFVRAARAQPLPFEYERARAYAEHAFGQERAERRERACAPRSAGSTTSSAGEQRRVREAVLPELREPARRAGALPVHGRRGAAARAALPATGASREPPRSSARADRSRHADRGQRGHRQDLHDRHAVRAAPARAAAARVADPGRDLHARGDRPSCATASAAA